MPPPLPPVPVALVVIAELIDVLLVGLPVTVDIDGPLEGDVDVAAPPVPVALSPLPPHCVLATSTADTSDATRTRLAQGSVRFIRAAYAPLRCAQTTVSAFLIA